MSSERGSSVAERWYHHIVAGLSLLGLAAGVSILWDLDRDQAVMKEQITGFEKQIQLLNAHTANRYTNVDAARDQAANTEIHRDMELRLRRLEAPPFRRE